MCHTMSQSSALIIYDNSGSLSLISQQFLLLLIKKSQKSERLVILSDVQGPARLKSRGYGSAS